jgi:hypothetical protein
MNPMIFPSFADYQSALQHPEMAFATNFLRQGLVESDLWGFPRVRSGGFALTYKVELKDITWAARCFHRVVRDRSIRYTQICQVLENSHLPFFVPTRYMHRGILVQGKHFPISILEWIEGESLENYVLHHLDDPDQLLSLGESFRKMCQLLEANNMAHGDLSHRNIIIKSDKIFLIDYDGMFVPSLSGRKSSELGNIHFQHPQRKSTLFSPYMDRFSSMVIYLALLGLSADPSLWKRFQSGGEGLIFQRTDFLNPHNSQLLRILEKLPLTGRFIPRFRQICLSPVEDIPSLDELIAHHPSVSTQNLKLWDHIEKRRIDIPVLPATEIKAIAAKLGEITTIVGKISEVFHGKGANKEEHVFINFGDWQNNCFTGVLWGSVLEDIQKMDLSIDSWVGEWMSISGLVSIRNGRPQIQVEAVTDWILLESEEKARSLLGKKLESAATKGATQFKLDPSHYTSKVIQLSDVFQNQSNTSTETVINQLYSTNRFKPRRKKSK